MPDPSHPSHRDRPSDESPRDSQRRAWRDKFADAFRGIALGVRGQSSFAAHLIIGLIVVVVAAAMQMRLWQWAALLLCIVAVLVAELFNTAIEWLARAIDRPNNRHIGGALDIAAGAVLLAAIGAAATGAIIFIHRLGELLGRW